MVKSRATMPRRAKAPRRTGRREDAQRIGEMIDCATKAKQTADILGERFLAYLLAMVIQEMSYIDARRAVTPRSAQADFTKLSADNETA